ncbi:MAG: DUF418 domain-containing protein [Steroidobacteraceae bacterium]
MAPLLVSGALSAYPLATENTATQRCCMQASPTSTQIVEFDAARLEGLDALRGFALLGLFLVHVVHFYDLYWFHSTTNPEQLRWKLLVEEIFHGKAFALMALCFGVSFFIIMDRSARRGIDFTRRFVWRLTLLGMLGFLHSLLYRYDFLEVLALMGLFLVPFHRVRSQVLVGLALLTLLRPLALMEMAGASAGIDWLQWPFQAVTNAQDLRFSSQHLVTLVRANLGYQLHGKLATLLHSGQLGQTFGLSLLGLYLGRIGFFSQPGKYARARLLGLAISLIALPGLYYADHALMALVPDSVSWANLRETLSSVLLSWLNLAKMAALMLTFTILYYTAFGRALNLLAPVGRMTLTLYVAQSLVFVPVFYAFGSGEYATMPESTAVSLGLAACVLQVLVANLWFRNMLYGPLEWLWRSGTYMTMGIPILRWSPR